MLHVSSAFSMFVKAGRLCKSANKDIDKDKSANKNINTTAEVKASYVSIHKHITYENK